MHQNGGILRHSAQWWTVGFDASWLFVCVSLLSWNKTNSDHWYYLNVVPLYIFYHLMNSETTLLIPYFFLVIHANFEHHHYVMKYIMCTAPISSFNRWFLHGLNLKLYKQDTHITVWNCCCFLVGWKIAVDCCWQG